jgi:hypothetical protein
VLHQHIDALGDQGGGGIGQIDLDADPDELNLGVRLTVRT